MDEEMPEVPSFCKNSLGAVVSFVRDVPAFVTCGTCRKCVFWSRGFPDFVTCRKWKMLSGEGLQILFPVENVFCGNRLKKIEIVFEFARLVYQGISDAEWGNPPEPIRKVGHGREACNSCGRTSSRTAVGRSLSCDT